MKKIKILSIIGLSGIVLAACNNTAESPVETETTISEETIESSSSELTQAEWMEQNEEATSDSFSVISNDSTLSSDVFELKFKQAEVIQSPSEDSKGVYLTFDLTNTAEDNIVPFEILTDYISMQQTTDTSVVFLDNTYYELDAFGDDTDSYNMMVGKHNDLSNELLPHKTIEVSYAYYLEDENLPIEVFVYDSETFEELDFYTIESLN
ncbi:DUF5067 domain-containing protein [Carnobacterium pleistocenium]|uniref:DUF5067 domain-containing protein n=1 Tax=Carnobacterium pleistocenium TaxID=181073 RepID=UPI00054FED02|nr:DUF5067 domain-containing protein [Carnobacterium pleistocenium]